MVLASAGLAASLLLGACTGGDSNTPDKPATPTGDLLPASPTALPPFDPATFQLLLAQLKGEPVVVNVWASWCGPCIQEAPALASAATRYEGRVQFLGVDIIDHEGPARAFIEKYGWTYPSVFDESGAIRDAMGLIGQPQTVIYDRTGARVCVRSGPSDEQFLTRTLDDILSGREVAAACSA
jgi:cytochrome c biogenesis protein CcmG/thiol:disulfide interchange protein DsbE